MDRRQEPSVSVDFVKQQPGTDPVTPGARLIVGEAFDIWSTDRIGSEISIFDQLPSDAVLFGGRHCRQAFAELSRLNELEQSEIVPSGYRQTRP
jgi:hypothetical protein